MLRSLLLSAAALLLSSTANACRCLPPPPLSDCEVRDDQAALLVTIKCVKTVICDRNSGVAVADVVIDSVFEDNTGLGLMKGDMTTISSLTQSATCGAGLAFAPGDQWIMFADPPFSPSAGNTFGESIASFSDGSICDVSDAVLRTDTCSGNIKKPSTAQIKELLQGCANN